MKAAAIAGGDRATLPRWRDPQAWLATADVFAGLTVATLPWSTSLPAIFATIWLVVLLPAIQPREFIALLGKPACYLPIALFVLALAGTLWSIAPWDERLHGVNPAAKLLLLPFLFYHFRHSRRGAWMFAAFVASCTLLMLLSWLVAYDPRLAIRGNAAYGVPVKNYIAQSQEFVLCIAALAWPLLELLRRRRYRLAMLVAAVIAGFVLNMMFVTVSRTALVTLPLLLGAFALLHMSRRAVVATAAVAVIAVAVLWVASPNLHRKLASIGAEFETYQTSDAVTSGGLRLEFWRKSLQFFTEAPLTGHGTGSTRLLFERAAQNQIGVGAEVIGNPHNQTLNVAVQWGIPGIGVLYVLWLCHLMLFRRPRPGQEMAAWIGLAVVLQNVASSLFNSHLFDFHEGWMYVLGVGIAGGVILAGDRLVDGQAKRGPSRLADRPAGSPHG